MNLCDSEAYWGAGNLTRWDHLAVRDVQMSSVSKQFLTEVGLPSPGRDITGWSLEWEINLPQFGEGNGLRLLGRNRGFSPFLIDESRDGCVVWRAYDSGFERYVNASVEQFATSLVEMDKFRQESWRTMDEPYDTAVFARRINALDRKLTKVDAAALATKEGMWRSNIFGMRLELK